MGDFNAKTGVGEEGTYIGKYGLGNRNDRSDRLAQFCADNQFIIANTFFRHHSRRLYRNLEIAS